MLKLNTIRFTYNSEHLHTVREEMKEERERTKNISISILCMLSYCRQALTTMTKKKKIFVDVKKKNHFMAYDRSNFITQKWKKEGFMYIKFYIFIE